MSEENATDNAGQEQNSSPAPETSWINPDGTFGDLSKAPEGVGEFITKKGYKDVVSWTNSHQELESMVGQRDKLIKIPEAGDEEGFREMATKLGCPVKAEDYEFTPQEGDPYDENLVGLFKQVAFKDGMPQNAFKSVVQFQIDAIKEANKLWEEQQANEQNEAQQALRNSFESEEDYNAYTQKALGFAGQFKLKNGETTAADVIERKGLAYDPEILEVFGTLADSTNEDALQFTKTSSAPSREQRLADIKKNPAFLQAMHPDHDKVMDEYWTLFNLKS